MWVCTTSVKGIVDPKNHHLLSLKLFQSCMNVFVLLNTKEDILKNVGNRAVLGHHWLPSYFFSYYGSQWCPKTAWIQTFFKISSFVFSITKKFIQVWNYLRPSKWQFSFLGGNITLMLRVSTLKPMCMGCCKYRPGELVSSKEQKSCENIEVELHQMLPG